MKRPYQALFLSLFILFSCSKIFLGKQLTEQQALDILVVQIKKDKLYDRWNSLSCLHFFTEEKTKNHFGFAIREKHDEQCLGDPDTMPLVDRFRVDRTTKKIQWESWRGEFMPYSYVLKARLKK